MNPVAAALRDAEQEQCDYVATMLEIAIRQDLTHLPVYPWFLGAMHGRLEAADALGKRAAGLEAS